ncbi:MAG: alpha-mannosidase [Candidatus Thorarchaeota archaeon]
MPKLQKVIIVSHTHWDREWYLPFEDFRWLLVKTLDQLIDLMETNPQYRYFTLDGQTIVLDDYLELRPENHNRLKQLITQNRIQTGPWYVLADEFLVSGEALVRNLLHGHRIARQFGNPMAIGYVPDTFGHIAQLPQIFKGFDINTSIWWRGLEDGGKTLPTELRWQAPDGSEVLLVHLRSSYSTAANLPNSVDSALAQLLMPLNVLALRGTSSAVLLMNGSDHLTPQPFLPDLIAALNKRFQSSDILQGKTVSQLLQEFGKSPIVEDVTGLDELSPFIDQLFVDFVQELQGVTMHHGTFNEYLDIVRNEVNLAELPVIEGEQHASKYIPVLPGVFSARLYLKQQNFATQQLLERWVEPFATIAWWLGASYPEIPLRRAWQLLLQNHPHDSICGCSVDDTHADMERRFAWSQQLGRQILSEAIHHINQHASSQPPPAIPQPIQAAFRVFNPHPWNTADLIRILLQLPSQPNENSQLALYNQKGEKIPFQSIAAKDIDPAYQSLIHLHTLPHIYKGETQIPDTSRQVLVTFSAQDIPHLGYTTFYLAPKAPNNPPHSTPALSLTQDDDNFVITNQFLHLQISKLDGTINLYHKPTRKRYSPLLIFEDTGDIGDEYNYCPPPTDKRITTQDEPPPKICILEQGPISVTVEVTTHLRVPQEALKTRQKRSAKTTTIPIQNLITISAQSPRIDIQTTFTNTAKDHRLRVLFPTHINTDTAWGDTPFYVTERSLKPAPQDWEAQLYPMMMDYYLNSILKRPNVPGKPLGWFEDSTTTHALQTFLDVTDGHQGLSIATRGLPEFEVLDDPNRTIALTLVRSVGWLSRGDLTTRRGHAGPELPTPGAQCLGEHIVQYSIIPHQGSWKNATALMQIRSYITPLKAIQIHEGYGSLPSSQGFLSIDEPGCVLSCLKKAEETESTILRLFEIRGEPSTTNLQLQLPILRASLVNLAEQPTQISSTDKQASNQIPVTCTPHQIRTLQLYTGSISNTTRTN